MDISDIKVDSRAIEDGEWVKGLPGMGDLELKVRGVGNSDWKALQRKLVEALPPERRIDGQISDEDSEEINVRLLIEAGLLEWRGLTDGDKVITYSKQLANQFMRDPDMRRFRSLVQVATNVVGTRRTQKVEAVAKN